MIADLIKKTRSYRRFYQDLKIELETLKELVELARLSAAAGNLQPLKYTNSAFVACIATLVTADAHFVLFSDFGIRTDDILEPDFLLFGGDV